MNEFLISAHDISYKMYSVFNTNKKDEV